jgi:hypothetical protein
LNAQTADLLARLEPLRRGRVVPDRLVRPRSHPEERRARLNLEQAELRRQERQKVDPAVQERKAMLRLHRSPVDAWGSRGVLTEVADYARFLAAAQEGRLSGAELLGLASRVHYAEPRGRLLVPSIEPALWTGDVGLMPSGPRALTAAEILLAADLLRSGRTWDWVARHFDVAENTLRRHIRDIAPRPRGIPVKNRT